MIKVLLVDDEALVRHGLRMILETAEDIEVVAEAGDGTEVLDIVRQSTPDVVLMDIQMSGMDGLAATVELSQLPQPPHVVVLTTFDLDEYVHRALECGAVGFLVKDTVPAELIRAVRVIADGNAMLSPSTTRRLISSFARDRSPRVELDAQRRLTALTDRETEVLSLVGAGLSNAEIARRLFMSEATVKAHVSRVLGKLGTNNRVRAAIIAYDAGLVESEPTSRPV